MAYVNKISANKEVWINTFTYKYIHTYLIINDKLQKLTWQKKKHEQTEMLNIDIYINIYSSYIYYTNKHSIDITYIHTSVLYVFWFVLLRFKTKVMNKSLTRFKVRFYSASFWWQKNKPKKSCDFKRLLWYGRELYLTSQMKTWTRPQVILKWCKRTLLVSLLVLKTTSFYKELTKFPLAILNSKSIFSICHYRETQCILIQIE